MTNKEIEALDNLVKELVAFPFPQICKHLAACRVLETMESLGVEVSKELAAAVVKADDEIVLKWNREKKE